MNKNDNNNDNYYDLENNNQYQDIFHDTDMIIPKNGYSLKSAVSFIGGKKKTNNKNNKNNKNDKNDNFSKKNDKFSNSISEELNLDHLAIPPSLYYMEYTVRPTYQNYSNTCGDDNNDNDDNDKMISDSVYDKLLLLAEDSSRKQKKYTKRNKKNDKNKKPKNRKTRRNK